MTRFLPLCCAAVLLLLGHAAADTTFLEEAIRSETGFDGAVTVVEYALSEDDPGIGYVTVDIPYLGMRGEPRNGQGRLVVRREDLTSGHPIPAFCHVHYEKSVDGAGRMARRGWAVATSHYGDPAQGGYPGELCIGDSVNLSRALIQWVRRLPFIDRTHLHIDGGSAGGYMTLAMSADFFPVAAATPNAPVCNWAYNLNYLEANKPASGYPLTDFKSMADLRRSPLPVLCSITGLADQSTAVFGKDLSADAYYHVSPIAYLDRITCPVLMLCATGDMLVPLEQVTKDFPRPIDRSLFPDTYSRDFDALTLNPDARRRVDELVSRRQIAVHVVPLPKGMHEYRLANFIKEEEEPPAPPSIDQPWNKNRQWNIVVLDEGPPKPDSLHTRYKWNTSPDTFIEAHRSATSTPAILNAAKLEWLIQRYTGELKDQPTLIETGKPANRLNFQTLERRDVVQGLIDYADMGPKHARRLNKLYARTHEKPFGSKLDLEHLRAELLELSIVSARPDVSFFDHCAFVSVDIQEGSRPKPLSIDQIPALWREMGFTAEDVNAANDFNWNVALPNAIRVSEVSRSLGLPMIFIHWGYRFEDGMDLDPVIRKSMLKEHGDDYSKWSGYIGQPGSQPAKVFNIQPGDYVIPKTGQDAFTSSTLDFVLRNLGVKNVIFVGGHTGACLGKTAATAKRLGYTTLCIRDATNNARESTRELEIQKTGYDYVMSTDEFVALAQSANK